VDADGAVDERASCGRRSRVVLTPRRRRQVGGSNSADDGDKQARSPGRARRKPLKPLRGECRAFSGVTVVTNARAFYTTRAAAGASGARHSLRPLIFEGKTFRKNSRGCAARSRSCVCRELQARHPARIRAAGWLAVTKIKRPSRTSQRLPHNPDAIATAPGGFRRCRPPPKESAAGRAVAARRCRGTEYKSLRRSRVRS
jgi:hypothetical protein